MMYVYKDSEIDSKLKVINDVEHAFKALDPELIVDDPEIKRIVHEIDRAILEDGIMHSPFGNTTIDNCSSGCKVAILVYLYNRESSVKEYGIYSINVVEAGSNAMRVISKLSMHFDVYIHCSRDIFIEGEHGKIIFRGKEVCPLDLLGEME